MLTPGIAASALVALFNRSAHAQTNASEQPLNKPPMEATAPSMLQGPPGAQITTPALPTQQPYRSTARFHFGRYLLEALGGGLAGGLAGYVVYQAMCDQVCLGGVLGGLGANVAVTPLATWAIGNALGGRGSLGYTYVGGLSGFAALGAPGIPPGVTLLVGMTVMPFASAALYEITSNVVGIQEESSGGVVASLRPGISPLANASGGLGGALLSIDGQF
jgi:hypothetical protein